MKPPARNPQPAIAVRNLSVSYDGKPILRSINLDFHAAKLIGIVGPNGAGKSTLLKAILGLIPIDQGRITIFGQPIHLARQRIAYVPQTEVVDWDFPVRVADVVLMGRYNRLQWGLWPGAEDRRHAMAALELVGMTPYHDRHIRRLSGGQRQRVFLARALCQQTDVLLLDEPFAGVDAATEQAIFDLIDQLTSQGRTLLLVNHDLAVVKRFDELLLINQRVVAFGPPDQAATDENFRQTYGGRLSLLDQADTALQQQPTRP